LIFKGAVEPKLLNLENSLDLRKNLFPSVLIGRRLFKFLFFYKNFKSVKLTKYFTKFLKQRFVDKLNFLHFNLNLILTNLPIYTSDLDSIHFIKYGMVFVNQSICRTPHYIPSLGDCVELIFFKKYLIFFKKYLIFFKKNILFFKKKKLRLKNSSLKKFNYILQFSKNNEQHFSINSKFIELDSQSYTIFILNQINKTYFLNYLQNKRSPIYANTFLNWKYRL